MPAHTRCRARCVWALNTTGPFRPASAKLTEELLKAAPGVHILATSRERLRAEDERVQRLTAAAALAYPAVQLCYRGCYELTDADAPLVAQICRRLDGIALAIELAAGRVGAFGVHGVAARLDNRFQLLTRGRRTALLRHQTLRAAFFRAGISVLPVDAPPNPTTA